MTNDHVNVRQYAHNEKLVSWDMIQLAATCDCVRRLIYLGYEVTNFYQDGYYTVIEVGNEIKEYGGNPALGAIHRNYTIVEVSTKRIVLHFNQFDGRIGAGVSL